MPRSSARASHESAFRVEHSPNVGISEDHRDWLVAQLRRACTEVLNGSGLSLASVSGEGGAQFEFRIVAVPQRDAGDAEFGLQVAATVEEPAFPDALLGRQFQLGASTYIFCGIDASRGDYPVVVEDVEDGTRGWLRDTPSLRAGLRALDYAAAEDTFAEAR